MSISVRRSSRHSSGLATHLLPIGFRENMILMAHPAKDPESPWWYGMLLQGGKSGWFPNSYVQEIKG